MTGTKEGTQEGNNSPEPHTEPPSERPGINVEIPKEDHSVYTTNQKRALVLIAALTGFLTPLSSSIYLPALNSAAESLHVTSGEISLSVTTFLIFQAISPSMIADFSDSAGRRPAYMICFILFTAANIGLALQNNYAALLVLRALQSAGSSVMVPLCSGVIADVTTSAERGSYMAYGFVSNILGPTLSPIIGGLLSQKLGWKSTFWFLVIITGPLFFLVLFFLPETSQRVVGNGLYEPPRLIHKSVTNWYLKKKWVYQGRKPDPDRQTVLREQFKFRLPNPITPLAIVFTKGPGLLILLNGLLIGVYYLTITSFPFIFRRTYGFQEIDIALMYIPLGLGSALSSVTTGRLTNWNYRRHAGRLGFPIEKSKLLDLADFPIERARVEVAMPLLYFGCAMLVVFGWTLDSGRVSLAAPIIVTFCIGWAIVAIYQVTAVLMIDMYPESPTTATAASTLVRCLLGAGSTAIVVPMIEGIGVGWTFTIAALVPFAFSPICFILIRKGPQWRREMKVKAEAKKQRKAALREAKGVKDEARRGSHETAVEADNVGEGIQASDKSKNYAG